MFFLKVTDNDNDRDPHAVYTELENVREAFELLTAPLLLLCEKQQVEWYVGERVKCSDRYHAYKNRASTWRYVSETFEWVTIFVQENFITIDEDGSFCWNDKNSGGKCIKYINQGISLMVGFYTNHIMTGETPKYDEWFEIMSALDREF